MTWRKRHLIYEFWISGNDYISTRVRIFHDFIDSILELIYVSSIFRRSSSSLLAIYWSKVAMFDCKVMICCYLVCELFYSFSLVVCVFLVLIKRSFVPDADFVLAEIFDVTLAFDEPYEFVCHSWEMYFFGSKKRKSFREIEFHLISENTSGASCCYPWFVCWVLFVCTVGSIDTVFIYVA